MANEITIGPGGGVGPLGRLDRVHHVGLGDVDQLVRQPFQTIRQRHDLRQLRCPRFIPLAGADEVHHPCHLSRQAVIVLADLSKKLGLVPGDEFHAIEIVAELPELTERCIEHSVLLQQECGRDAVELARGIVLDLMIGCDLALLPDQHISLLVDPAQHLQPHRAKHDEEPDDGEKRGQQLGLNARRQPGDPADQPVPDTTRPHRGA